jgi:hypothetical protein
MSRCKRVSLTQMTSATCSWLINLLLSDGVRLGSIATLRLADNAVDAMFGYVFDRCHWNHDATAESDAGKASSL